MAKGQYRTYVATVLAVAGNARKAWIELAYIDEAVRLRESSAAALEQSLQLATTDYTTGRAMGTLATQVRVTNDIARVRVDLAVLADRRTAVRVRFKAALGLVPTDRDPPWPQASLTITALPTEEELWRRAAKSNPELGRMRAMVEMAIAGIEVANKARMPDFSVGVMSDLKASPLMVRPTATVTLPIWREKITVSFLPVFTLQAQEGRMFKPLAFTKTYSMGAAALLSITLAPVLMGFFIRGKIPAEGKNPINRFLLWLYHPLLDLVIKFRWAVIFTAAFIIAWVFFPWNAIVTRVLPEGSAREIALKVGKAFPFQNLGSEFMPPLYEGDLLYMPTTFPGISPTKAREILQQTDQMIRTFGEVHHVFGKIGRAESATDPAPMDMVETTIMLKEEKDWPAVDINNADGKVTAHRRRTIEELITALNTTVQIPIVRRPISLGWLRPQTVGLKAGAASSLPDAELAILADFAAAGAKTNARRKTLSLPPAATPLAS